MCDEAGSTWLAAGDLRIVLAEILEPLPGKHACPGLNVLWSQRRRNVCPDSNIDPKPPKTGKVGALLAVLGAAPLGLVYHRSSAGFLAWAGAATAPEGEQQGRTPPKYEPRS